MGSSNRQPYLTTSVLDQAFLDECASNLECRLELAADIQAPDGSIIHVSDRNKFVVNSGVGTFYQARTVFPVIRRTLGEWLSTEVEFSSLQFDVSNVDSKYASIMPGGASFAGWIGREVTVSLGVSEIGATYSAIFQGRITDVAGFSRNVKSFSLTARDRFDVLNVDFPTKLFTLADFPHIDDDVIGTARPMLYGDWTVALVTDPAQVPGLVVNGGDLLVNSTKTLDVRVSGTTAATFTTGVRHKLQDGDQVNLTVTPGGTLPSPFIDNVTYYVVNPGSFTFQLANSSGGTPLANLGGGSGAFSVKGDPTYAKRNVQCFVSDNVNAFLDTNNIWLKRGDLFYRVPPSEIANVSGNNNYFEVLQQTLNNWIVDSTVDPQTMNPFIYADGDLFFCQAKGKDLGAYSDNIVWQARDLLMTVGGLTSGDFDASWAAFRDKASPAQSAIASIKSRVWVQEQTPVMQYVQSMITQVRLQLFQSRSLQLSLVSLHFEDFQASPGFTVKQWDIVRDSVTAKLDERINFNRAQGSYNFLPASGQEAQATTFYRNQAAIDQTAISPLPVKPIGKILVFPNLYVEQDVTYQVIEMLKLASSTLEVIELNLTWRSMLLDLGNFVSMDVNLPGYQFSGVPCMIREIGYDPQGLKIPVKLWSFQMTPFPGYVPGNAGTVGGYNATIVSET